MNLTHARCKEILAEPAPKKRQQARSPVEKTRMITAFKSRRHLQMAPRKAFAKAADGRHRYVATWDGVIALLLYLALQARVVLRSHAAASCAP